MEIIDYLRVARERRRVLILVPLLATLLAAAFVLLSPRQYTATATVTTSSLVGGAGSPYAGTQGAAQFVGAFTAAAASPQTKAAVQTATGVSPAEQTAGIDVEPVSSNSSDMKVTYVGTDQDKVEGVARETSKGALAQMFATRTAQAAAARDQANEAVKAANAAVTELSKANGVAEIPKAYDALLGHVASLRQQQATLRATGNAIAAAALDAPIADAQKNLDAYVPVMGQYSDLAAKQAAATSDLSTAQEEYRHAQTLQASSIADGVVFVGPTTAVEKTTRFVQFVLPVLGASIFLAVVLVLVLEMLSRVRAANRKAREEEAHEAALNAPDAEAGESGPEQAEAEQTEAGSEDWATPVGAQAIEGADSAAGDLSERESVSVGSHGDSEIK